MTCSCGVASASSMQPFLRRTCGSRRTTPSARGCGRRRRAARARRAATSSAGRPRRRRARGRRSRTSRASAATASRTAARRAGRRAPARSAPGAQLALALQLRRRAPAGGRARRRRGRGPTGSSSGGGGGHAAPRRRASRGRGTAARSRREPKSSQPSSAGLPVRAAALRPVFRVDLHVFRRQIAGPHRGVVAAAGAEIDVDRGCPCPADTRPPSARSSNGRPFSNSTMSPIVHRARRTSDERRAGPAGGGDQAAPVRIAAVDRRSSRAASWRSRAPPAARRRRCARRSPDGDQLGRALAAADDAERELAARHAQRLDERGVDGLVDRARRWRRWPARTRSRWSSIRRRR